MATVSRLAIYCSRLKTGNFRKIAINYCTNRPNNPILYKSKKYWYYLIGGGILTGAFGVYKWQRLGSVSAYQPKKVKVSKTFSN